MEKMKRLADTAEAYAKQLDLTISPSLHITKALQGIPEGRERDLLFGEIRTELNRRKRENKKEQADLEDALRQRTLREARAHELRQPRDTWDPHTDDEPADEPT